MKTLPTFLTRSALTACAIGLALMVGCQGQTEGERCSLLNGKGDCTGDLVCTPASNLRADDGVNRCCPDGNEPITDDRCLRRVGGGDGSGGSGGPGGATGEGGAGPSGGANSGGANATGACRYTSDCEDGLVCGPGGVCQKECQDDIDCPDGLICSAEQNCVTPAP
jgi:hypothetical protein